MDVEAAESSSATENLAATQSAATGEQIEAAAPATGESNGSLLDAVKAAIEEKKPEEAPAKADEAQPEEKPAENPEAKAEGDKEADDKLLPFHNHPRFKQVISERKDAIKRAEAAERRIAEEYEPLKADAGHYQSIVGYMGSNNLSMTEVNTGFEIMATMKNDPLRCLELLRPYYQHLQQFAGEILPDDLAGKVESGDVEEAIARQAAAHRHQAEFERQKRAEVEQRQSHDQQRQAQEQAAGQIMGALTQWEAQVKSSDPDYAKKEDFVIAELKAVHLSRPPRSAQEAVANAKAAYEKVNGRLAAMRPAPTPAVPVSSASSITGAREQPKSALEAAKQGLANMRR
jgi:hypothetical protein